MNGRTYDREDFVTHPRHAGQVKRYHTWQTIKEQTVAEHSWQVYRLYQQLFGQPSADVACFIMWHDAGELVSGDVPFPVKSLNSDLKETMDHIEHEAVEAMGVWVPDLSKVETRRVKLCDLLEMWEFGMQEIAMGNSLAEPITAATRLASLRLAEEIGVIGKVAEVTYPWRAR